MTAVFCARLSDGRARRERLARSAYRAAWLRHDVAAMLAPWTIQS